MMQLNYWLLIYDDVRPIDQNIISHPGLLKMKYFKVQSPALIMAGLGFISGILCTYLPSIITDITFFDVPVFHGIIFGSVIAFGLLRFAEASRLGAITAVVFTVFAWIAAVRSFNLITGDASSNLYLGALVAGGIGASGTMAGGAATVTILRKPLAWLLITVVGALAGLLVVPVVHSSDEKFLLLFIVWQSAVAFGTGHVISSNKLPET